MPRASSSKPSTTTSTDTLGQRLVRLRKERGLTQVQLAEKMGIVQVLVSDYELEKIRPNPDVLVRYAQALGVSADEILGIARAKKTEPAGPPISRRLLRRLQQFDKLPKRDQDALLRTIDAFLGRGNAA